MEYLVIGPGLGKKPTHDSMRIGLCEVSLQDLRGLAMEY